MSDSIYFTLKLSNVRQSDLDLVTEVVFALGAEGTSEELDFEQTAENYEPVSLAKDLTVLNCYFSKIPDRQLLESLQQKFPGIEVQLEESVVKDWMEEWKKGFESFALTGNVWVVPSWLQPPSEAEKIIKVDPGMAFGTGTHATTQLAAGLLSQYQAELSGCSLIDVGTGTGILAILAQIFGCQTIKGIEIDEVARNVARENVQLNKAANVIVTDESVEQVSGEYDWVVANIIDGVLLKIRADLTRLTKPGGRLLLTGILQERLQGFLPHWLDDFDVVVQSQQDEWVGCLLEKKL